MSATHAGLMEFDRMSLGNLMARALAIATSEERSDQPGSVPEECNFLRFRLGQVSEREPTVWFELLVASILSSTAESDIRSLNPYLSSAAYKTVTSLTVVAMLASIRIGQSHRALAGLSHVSISYLLHFALLRMRCSHHVHVSSDSLSSCCGA